MKNYKLKIKLKKKTEANSSAPNKADPNLEFTKTKLSFFMQ